MKNQQDIAIKEKYIKSKTDVHLTQIDTMLASMKEYSNETTLVNERYSPVQAMDPDFMRLLANALLCKFPESDELEQSLLLTVPDDRVSIPAQMRRVLALQSDFIQKNKGFNKLLDTLNRLLIPKALQMERPDVVLSLLSDPLFPFKSATQYTLFKYPLYQGTSYERESTYLWKENIPLLVVAILYCASYDIDFIISMRKHTQSSNTNNSKTTTPDLTLLQKSNDIKMKYKTWNQIAQLLIKKDDLTDEILLNDSERFDRSTVIDYAFFNGQTDIVSSLLMKLNMPSILSMASTKESKENKIRYFTERSMLPERFESWLEKMDLPECDDSIFKIWALLTVQKLFPMGYNSVAMAFSGRRAALFELISVLKLNGTITRDAWITNIYNALYRVDFPATDENKRWEEFRSKLKGINEKIISAKQNVPEPYNAVSNNNDSNELNDESLYERIEKLLIDQNCPALAKIIKSKPSIDLTRKFTKLYSQLPKESFASPSITLIPAISYFMLRTAKGLSAIKMDTNSVHLPSASIEWANLLMHMLNSKMISTKMLNEPQLFVGYTLLAMAVNSNQRELARALIEAGSMRTYFGPDNDIRCKMEREKYSGTVRMLGYDDKEMITPSLMRLLANFFIEYEKSTYPPVQLGPLEQALLNVDPISELLIADSMRDFLTSILKCYAISISITIEELLAKLNDMLIPLALKHKQYDVLLKLLNQVGYPFYPTKLYGEHTLMDVAILNKKNDIVYHLLNRYVSSNVQSKYIEHSDVAQYWLDEITEDCNLLILKLWALATVDKLSPMSFNNRFMIVSGRRDALNALIGLIYEKDGFLANGFRDPSEVNDDIKTARRSTLIQHIFAAVKNVKFPDLRENDIWNKLHNKLETQLSRDLAPLYSEIARHLRSRNCEALAELIDKSPKIDFSHSYHFSEVNVPDYNVFVAPLTLIKVLGYFIDVDIVARPYMHQSPVMQPTAEQNKWAALLSHLIKRERISPELLNANVIPNFSLLYCAILINQPALARAIIEAGSLSCSCGDQICALHMLMNLLMVDKSGFANLLMKTGFSNDKKLTIPLILFFSKFLINRKLDKNMNIMEDTDELLILQNTLKLLTPGPGNNISINECGFGELRDALIDHAIANEKPEVLLDVLKDEHYKFDSGKLYYYENLSIYSSPVFGREEPAKISFINYPMISIAIRYIVSYQPDMENVRLVNKISASDVTKEKCLQWKQIFDILLKKPDLTDDVLSKQFNISHVATPLDHAIYHCQDELVMGLLSRAAIPAFSHLSMQICLHKDFWINKIDDKCDILILKLCATAVVKKLSGMSFNSHIMYRSRRKKGLDELSGLLEPNKTVTREEWITHIYNALKSVNTFDPEADIVWIALRNKVFGLCPEGVQMKKFDVSKDDDARFNPSDSLADSARDGIEMKTFSMNNVASDDDDDDLKDPEAGTKLAKIPKFT